MCGDILNTKHPAITQNSIQYPGNVDRAAREKRSHQDNAAENVCKCRKCIPLMVVAHANVLCLD